MRIAFVLLLFLFSCDNEKGVKKERMINGKTEEKWKSDYIDSVKNSLTKKMIPDSISLTGCPVSVTKANLFKDGYSNYKSISLTYRNISNKRIEAIRFNWYGEDAFGEPADMGGYLDGMGGGFTDDPLGPGKSTTSVWSILSSRGKKVIKAWAYEVAFSDGTKWELQE